MPITLICATCQKPFQALPGDIRKGKKYCGRPCYFEARRKIWRQESVLLVKQCDTCHKDFLTYPSRIKERNVRFCSKECTADGLGRSLPYTSEEERKAARRKDAQEYRKRHPERVAIDSRNRRAKNPEKVREYQKSYFQLYYSEHKEEICEYQKSYRATHREQGQRDSKEKRRRKQEAALHDLSLAQWKEILTAHDYRCAYCNRKMQRLTQDHITPIYHHGSHTLHNIVPACISCNSKKHTGPPLKPVQPLLLTIAPSKPKAP